MNKNIRTILRKYRVGIITGGLVSAFVVLLLVGINATAYYAMDLKESEMERYYEAREHLIEGMTMHIFNEYLTNHIEDDNTELQIYVEIVDEANLIMDEHYEE